MIKSRGYRIELGEIESALLSHPAMREAAAIAVPDEVVGNRIKAIVAAHKADSVQAAELQQHCGTLSSEIHDSGVHRVPREPAQDFDWQDGSRRLGKR